MKFTLLNEDSVDSIVDNYSSKRFNYHLLLTKLIEQSRNTLSDQISIFSADLNTLFRKGPMGKQKKIIFKWLQSVKVANKENISKSVEDIDIKGEEIIAPISDFDK